MAVADVVITGTVLTVDDARATAEAFAADMLEVGKYADMVVLSADPRTVPPERIADLEVRATFLAGRQVYAQ